MPIYSYRCKDCGYEFDQRQRMSDDPLTICPVCEGSIRRVVNSVGVVFKGSGFYVTDNRGTNSANSVNGKSSETASSNAEKPSETKTASPAADTKKATTSASAPA
jgi:putative FmdB family regulatory protein